MNLTRLPRTVSLALACLVWPGALYAASPLEPQPFRVAASVPDLAELPSPSAVKLQGFLGRRVELNATARLAKVDLEPLLAGFRKKPGEHPWIGEHLGKWMHAATLAWAYTGDPTLKAKLDYAAAELAKAQEPDGYLGTYVSEKRFGLHAGADWDVWSHKYCLMGLLTYYQYTGNPAALATARKVGDLLVSTFGPGRKSILSAGTHVGMAATSVLEPMVLLYRFTGDVRYLEFSESLVKSWEAPGGPRVMHTLLTEKSVQKTANGKAYEMLSNLVGLCELYCVTGERDYLQAALNAWQDIVDRRLYLTGSASQGEHFRADHELPNGESAHVAETCVTTTWMQLNQQLLRLTGEARFADELERTYYNHLAAAQRPDGAEWCYFTSLEGRKPYGPGINCCVSSGPRGMALVPRAAAFTYRTEGEPGIALCLFDLASFSTVVNDEPVKLSVTTDFPRAGRATVTVNMSQAVTFALKVRQPPWGKDLSARLAGQPIGAARGGWLEIPPRAWQPGERLELAWSLAARLIPGTNGNAGKAALAWGPFVLAYDAAENPGGAPASALALVEPGARPLAEIQPATDGRLRFAAAVRSPASPEPLRAVLVPFADAGGSGGVFRVWLRAPGSPLPPPNPSLLAVGSESRSREGNVTGAINDGEPATFVVTFDGRPAAEDWFAVTLDRPATVRRVVFTQGRLFHDGGWFDASAGKPRVQVQRERGGSWETVGTLADYPATSARSNAGLKEGQSFALTLAAPVEVLGVRVLGQPARGDNPEQAFAACAELEAF